jgi:putative salt-induced outer membrane protein YdiY
MFFGSKRAIKNMRPLIPALLMCGAFSSLSAHAGVVTLNNGDQLSGKLEQLSKGILTVKSDILGEVKIPWGNVSKLQTDDDVRVQLNNGATIKGRLMLNENGSVSLGDERSVQTQTLARQDIAALNPPIADESVKYSGKADLGGALNRGNSRDDQLHLSGEFVARTPQDRYTLNWEVNEARSADVKTTSNRRLLGQYDMFLDPKNYMFVNAKAERDELADLNLRSGLGGGYGRQFVDTDLRKLSGEIGLSYVREDYENASDRSFPTLGLGFKYEQKFFKQKLVYFNNLNVDTNLQDTSDVLLRNRMGIRIPIANGINLSTQFNIDYDNQPAADTKKTDTALIFSLGYAF